MGQHVPFDSKELHSLNSFLHQFIRGSVPYDTVQPGGLYRDALHPWWGTKEIAFLKEAARFSGAQLRMYCERKSERRLQQTHAEFFAEIDRTIIEVGLTVEEVAEKINIYLYFQYQVNRATAHVLNEKLDEFLAPVYIALRNKGYNRADLMG